MALVYIFLSIYFSAFLLNLTEICHLIKNLYGIWFKCPRFFIINLAAVDLVFGIGGIGHVLLTHLLKYKDIELFRILFIFGKSGSLTATALLTLDQFIATMYPFMHAKWRTQKCITLVLGGSWLITFLLQASHLLKIVQFRGCRNLALSIIIIATGIFMISAYYWIIRNLRKTRIAILDSTNAERELKPTRPIEKRLILTSLFMTVLFLTMTIPYAITNMLSCARINVSNDCHHITFIIFAVKTVIDPIIYLAGHARNTKMSCKVSCIAC